MKTILLILSLLILTTYYSLLNSNLWEIKQDGTGDFTTITEGIDAAVDGDTLLVYPGVYYENINYWGKNIVITSLYGIESDDRSLIRETVIDGMQRETVVRFENNESNDAVLNGLTITNGYSNNHIDGGGISIFARSAALASSPTISNCIITDNISHMYGGGISVRRSAARIIDCLIEKNRAHAGAGLLHFPDSDAGYVFLAGNTFRYNHAVHAIGGVRGVGVKFCNANLNSIYLNYSGIGADLLLGELVQDVIVIDTFTVVDPDPDKQVFISHLQYTVPDDFRLEILNAKIEPVKADLYVSADGCDNNTGLTPDDPLQTIMYASIKIDDDCEQRRNIFVADGVYSKSLNNQIFPVMVRCNTNIIGESRENTILDIEVDGWGFSAVKGLRQLQETRDYRSNFSIKNFTIINGGYINKKPDSWPIRREPSGIKVYPAFDFEIENINVYNGISELHGPIYLMYVANKKCKNIEIRDCRGGTGFVSAYFAHGHSDKVWGYIENLRITGFRDIENISNPMIRAGNSMSHGAVTAMEKPLKTTIVNLEITDGTVGKIEWPETSIWGNFLIYGGQPHQKYPYTKVRLINATIGNNITIEDEPFGGGLSLVLGLDLEIINSIIYGNKPNNIVINQPDLPMNVRFSHSILGDGLDSIRHFRGEANIDFDLSNMTLEPSWAGKNVNPDYPYMLSKDSPARGAGTLDIPDFEFPAVDLAGNPRVVNGRIDIGAYQWPSVTTSIEEEEREGVTERLRDGEFNLRNFPNPVTYLHSDRQSGQTRSSTGTTISFEAPESGEVVIEIYNVKGQFVRRVFDAYITKGEYNVFWDGKDERGRYVATGFYMYNLHFNDELVATGRATFIK